MGIPDLLAFHTVVFLGFYLPPLIVCAVLAIAPFVALRWLFKRLDLYRFVWHRSLFNLSLYVLLVGGIIALGTNA